MYKKIYGVLKVRPDEERNVTLLLAMGFFLGIFLAIYGLSAETLFLNRLGGYLKEAMIVSGALGLITTALFAYIQTRVRFSALVIGNFLLISVFTAGMYTLLHLGGPELEEAAIFILFAMIGPILAVVLLSYWGVFVRIFNLRQSKRIIGWIDTGQLIAAILALYTVPFISGYLPDTSALLLISAISVLCAVIVLFFIVGFNDLRKAELVPTGYDQGPKPELKIKTFFTDNYIRLLSLFMILSVLAFSIIQYTFQEVAQIQYPDETDLRNFLAGFNGTIITISLLMQTFVNEKIISNYGLKVALMILPVILIVFCGLSVFAGFWFGYQVSAEASTFLFFFLFIALTRLFSASIREALENPSFKLFFMPLDNRIRFDVQTRVEGVVNEFARLLGGGLILSLSLLPFFELIHYMIFMFIILVLYIYLIAKMYHEYRNKIRVKLESQEVSSENWISGRDILKNNLTDSIKAKNPSKAVFSYKLLEKMDPAGSDIYVNELVKHQEEKVQDFAQIKLNEIRGLSVSERFVIFCSEEGMRQYKDRLIPAVDIDHLFVNGDVSRSRIARLSQSISTEDRLYAAELIGHVEGEDYISYMIELLSDPSEKVRIATIKTAQKKYNDEVISALVDNLNNPRYNNLAANTLVAIGVDALPILDSGFYRSGQSDAVMLKIVQIMGRIGGNRAIGYLWAKMDYPDKGIVSQVLASLGECQFKAGVTQVTRIINAIESDIRDIAWNFAAIGEVDDPVIKQAIIEENEHDIDHIYMLLGMLYDSKSIQLVKENMDSGTVEGVIYALELLDVFLSENLKKMIIPVLEDVDEAEKASRLEVFFPRNALDSIQVLRFLINRDVNQTNRYTKACCIHKIGKLKLSEYTLDLVSNLYHPDLMVREVAGWALFKISKELYEEHTARLEEEHKIYLDELILKQNQDSGFKSLLKLEKVIFLKSTEIFSEVNGLTLTKLIDIVEEVQMEPRERISWDGNDSENFFLVFEGTVNILYKGSVMDRLKSGSFIGELVEDQLFLHTHQIEAESPTRLIKIVKERFYEILGDNEFLARKVVGFM